jgi:hypothetical protein
VDDRLGLHYRAFRRHAAVQFQPDPIAAGGLVGLLHPRLRRLRFLSVCKTRGTRLGRVLFWAAIVAPALAYWTCMVFEVQNPEVYRALLAVVLGALAWLAVRRTQQSAGALAAWFALVIAPGLWAVWRASTNVETGMDFLLLRVLPLQAGPTGDTSAA